MLAKVFALISGGYSKKMFFVVFRGRLTKNVSDRGELPSVDIAEDVLRVGRHIMLRNKEEEALTKLNPKTGINMQLMALIPPTRPPSPQEKV